MLILFGSITNWEVKFFKVLNWFTFVMGKWNNQIEKSWLQTVHINRIVIYKICVIELVPLHLCRNRYQ